MSSVPEKASSHAKAESSNQSYKMNVVGLEDDLKKVKKLLTEKEPKFLGIAIHGESGSGKTTLARHVYKDDEVIKHFKVRAWFTVGTKWMARDVLASLLYSLASGSKTPTDIAKLNWTTLKVEVSKVMEKHCCLIVLDDVFSRSSDIWEDGLESAKDIENGSRMIITTRMKPEDVKAKKTQEEHPMKWVLFNRISELQPDAKWVLFKQISGIEETIRNCYGLPLAIVIIASMCKGMLSEFGRVKKELEEISKFSYEKLPDHLKQCLQYLRGFPEEDEISVEKLRLLWVAEGITPKLDVAKGYYNELIASGLVIELERDASCKLLHSIPDNRQKLSKGVYSLEVLPSGNKSVTQRPPMKLAIYLDKGDVPKKVLSEIQLPEDVESILFFDVTKMGGKDKRSIDLKKFKSTQVLYFNGVEFQKEKCLDLEKLQGLKCLSFEGCNLEELPSSIKKNKDLETLDLGVQASPAMILPNELKELSKLRHLYLPRAFRTKDNSKLDLKKAINLEILENFDPENCDLNDQVKKKLLRLTCIEV